ncbi:Predicted DNA-binding transcriptional regulator YafY, contains an HTH and WYL domains [Lachnospiraceae bacterium]|nr:Predicted DNA-binding transcriptional regulator YafY, contains an HTH and WYL domains [Lachnospiraceae bacterium]
MKVIGTGSKKVLILQILDILKKYSDEDHPLTQQEIIRYLKDDGTECDRRSVRANVQALQDYGFEISMEKDGYCLYGRSFDETELRLLIDSVYSSRSIPRSRAQVLIGKLKNEASIYFEARVNHITNLPDLNQNKKLYSLMDQIDKVIDEKKKLRFTYNSYGSDLKLHPTREKPYIVSPYQIAAVNGWYYLVGNTDGQDGVSYYRLDKITKAETLDEKLVPMKNVKGLEKGLNLPKLMVEHVNLYSGDSVPIQFIMGSNNVDALVDWLGKDFTILEDKAGKLKVKVICNEEAFYKWSLQYGADIEVLQPADLRKKIAATVAEMSKRYKK